MNSAWRRQNNSYSSAMHSITTAVALRRLFTFAPRTPLLALMIKVGRLLPQRDRAPWIEPVSADKLWQLMSREASLLHWQAGRTLRVASGFYTSQAMEWKRL